ncbi:MAG: dethiobiotin synthase [Pseudomonadota bacterium]
MTLDPILRQNLFIAGTDTAVGKTWVATRLLMALGASGLRVAGMKPVAAGATLTPAGLRNEDALALAQAGNVALAYETLNPYCLAAATSPHIAARYEAISIDIAIIMHRFSQIVGKTDIVVVEGAGGWMAPIGDPLYPGTPGPTMADVAQKLGLPVLLVVGMRLGCISHALLTADAIRTQGLQLAGWIANPIDPDFLPASAGYAEYVEALEQRLPAPRLQVY